MCILLASTNHPNYSLILLNNRDVRRNASLHHVTRANMFQEFLNRPTARANWWDAPNGHVLGGRDLQRSVRGTWLGITKQGRVAVLTNFREQGAAALEGARSRGEIPIAFLAVDPSSEENEEAFAKRLIEEEGIQGVGGLSLAFGLLKSRKNDNGAARLAFISNRTPDAEGLEYSKAGTWGLSNSHFGDRAWPKVVNGEKLLDELIEANSRDEGSADDLVEECFKLLSTDTLPTRQEGEAFQTYTYHMRKSIFVPAVGDELKEGPTAPADELAAAKEDGPAVVVGGLYGTQKQTVILVDHEGHVIFRERTLYDHDAKPITGAARDVIFDFTIEGWHE